MPLAQPPSGAAPSSLTYEGTVIRQRHETLSLTDMWKAAGSPSGRGPSDWLALVTTKEFVSAVEAGFNAGKSGIETRRGGSGENRGSTFAHWQIGLAYAKYLSPEFHMWCNSVVRERMEGRPAATALTAVQVGGITKAVVTRALAEIRSGLEDVLAGYDPAQIVTTEFQPMLAVLDGMGVLPKGRRTLSQRCSRLCMRWLLAQGRGADIRVSRETKRFLFRTSAAQDWMAAAGAALVAAHKDRIAGQGVMQFTRPRLITSGTPVPPPAAEAAPSTT